MPQGPGMSYPGQPGQPMPGYPRAPSPNPPMAGYGGAPAPMPGYPNAPSPNPSMPAYGGGAMPIAPPVNVRDTENAFLPILVKKKICLLIMYFFYHVLHTHFYTFTM